MFTVFEICILVTTVIVSVCLILYRTKSVNKKKIRSNKIAIDSNKYECRLIIDSDQKLIYEWLQNDTQQNVTWTTSDQWGDKSMMLLKDIQNAAWNTYPSRFPAEDDTENDFYFRCGKLVNVDRFDLILIPTNDNDENIPMTFGHIEFVYVYSYKLKKQIVWLYMVYIAHMFRGQGLGKLMMDKSLDYCHNDKRIEEVHLIVCQDNIRAQKLYKKCGFTQYMTADDEGRGLGFVVMKHIK
eukprot:384910_1